MEIIDDQDAPVIGAVEGEGEGEAVDKAPADTESQIRGGAVADARGPYWHCVAAIV